MASDDYQLGDYRIPKGIIVNVPVYALHHDKTIWSDPEKFIPERLDSSFIINGDRIDLIRFSVEEKAKRHPMAFLPFGDGPR